MLESTATIHKEDFKAQDIFTKWKGALNKAEHSIDILSPYIDSTASRLIKYKNKSDSVQKRIYTRVDAQTIFDKHYQIDALIKCYNIGVSIYHIKDLHAKMLIVDNSKVSIGSQNFTVSGTENKEVSFISEADFKNSDLLNDVMKWQTAATLVPIEYLLKLKELLKNYKSKINKLRKALESDFDDLEKEEEERVKKELELARIKKDKEGKRRKEDIQNELRRNIKQAKEKSKIQFQSEYVVIKKEWCYLMDRYKYIVEPGYDLTIWNVIGKKETKIIDRISLCPMLKINDGSMSFIRLASKQISLQRRKEWRYPFVLYKKFYSVIIEFPLIHTNENNIIINLNRNKLYFYFNGKNFRYTKGEFETVESKIFLTKYLIHNKMKLQELIREKFKIHKRKGHGEPIGSFLSDSIYKLYLIEYLGNTIIVAE